jgi:hypothetical protein
MPKYRDDNVIDFKKGDLVKANSYSAGNHDYPKVLSVDYNYATISERRKNANTCVLNLPSNIYAQTASVYNKGINGEHINRLLSIVDGLISKQGMYGMYGCRSDDYAIECTLLDANRKYDGLICEFYEIYNIEEKDDTQVVKYMINGKEGTNITPLNDGVYLAFRRYDSKNPDLSNDFVFIHYTDYTEMIEILKDLKVASINEVEKWA